MRHLLTFFLLAILVVRYTSSIPNYTNGQLLKVSGHVFSEPTLSFTTSRFNLSGLKVSLSKGPEIHYGDYIILTGVYQDGELVNTRVINQKPTTNFLIKIRRSLIGFYKSGIKEPHASLVAGITIGAKSGLPRNFLTKLNNTGTSHIVVASGTNVMLVAGFLMNIFLLKLTRRQALILTSIFIWMYTLYKLCI